MNGIDAWLADFHNQADELPGAALPWLGGLRRRAMERFADEGWPSSRQEAWRHTSLAFLEQAELTAPATVPDPAQAVVRLRAEGETADHWLVFVGGRHAPALSAMGRLPAGAHLGSLAEAFMEHAETVEHTYGRAAEGDSPTALNTALASDGAFIRLGRGVELDGSIHLVFLAAAGVARRHLRNLVIAEAGASARIVEHYPDGGGATLTTVLTRIQAGGDARITHLKLQQENVQAIHLASLAAEQARGASFSSHSLSFGARLARHDIRTRFDGEGCEALLNGLYHVDGRRHVGHHTDIEHAQPRGTSREYYRGLLDGSARGVFCGRIVVAPGAQRSDAMQRCDNLLLSRQAEADARPELEIYADDVKCAHGATVGQLDDASLFYLRSRGLDDAHARRLLTWAFAALALGRIEPPRLRQLATAALRARLPGTDMLDEPGAVPGVDSTGRAAP